MNWVHAIAAQEHRQARLHLAEQHALHHAGEMSGQPRRRFVSSFRAALPNLLRARNSVPLPRQQAAARRSAEC